MSQPSQQDDGPYDALPQFSSQDSPTVGRHQAQYVASNPNPALDLGKRFVVPSAPQPPFSGFLERAAHRLLSLQVPAQGRPESSSDEHHRALCYFSDLPLLRRHLDLRHAVEWHSHQNRLCEDRCPSVSRWESYHTGRAALAKGASR